MLYKISILLLLIFQFRCSAQLKPGCINAALGYSNIANEIDPFSIFNNPAASALASNPSTAIFYSPAPFGLNELSSKAISAGINTKLANIQAGYSLYGYELYKEQKFALALSFDIQQKFLIGISAIYQNVSIKNYGNDWAIIFLLGGIYRLTDNFNLAFTIFNPNNTSYGNENNQIPVYFEAGLAYKISESAQLTSALHKELNYPICLTVGFTYKFLRWISFYGGYKNDTEIFSAGLSVSYSDFTISYGVNSHSQLGLSHLFGFQFGMDN